MINKQKLIPILSGLLVAQLLLAAVLHFSVEDYAPTTGGNLLSIDMTAVDGVRIADEDSVTEIRKRDGSWQVVEHDFPANEERVADILDKLVGFQKRLPVGNTADTAKRFKVSDPGFERKFVLYQGDKVVAELLIGGANIFRHSYVRLADDDDIYTVEFNLYDYSGVSNDWINKSVIERDIDDIAFLKLPSLTLTRGENGELTVDKLKAGQETNTDEAEALLAKVAGLKVHEVLGREPKPEFNQDKPSHLVTLGLKDGREIVYTISRLEGETYYVLKSSDQENYYRIPGYLLDAILETELEQLVQAKQADEHAVDTASTTQN